MRIVCGTDFSTHARAAADVAAALARRMKEFVILLHVVEKAEVHATSPEVERTLLEAIEDRLAREADRLRKSGALVKEKLVFGSPYEVLPREAGHAGTRLVVVSSLGQISPSRFLVGSVAERTAESSPVPTLVVHDPAPFIAWTEGRPLKIFAGHDFSTTGDSALQWVKTLSRIGPCEVTVGHVASVPRESQRLGPAGPPGDQIRACLEHELREKVAAHLADPKAAIIVRTTWGRPESELLQMSAEAGADLGTPPSRMATPVCRREVACACSTFSPQSVARPARSRRWKSPGGNSAA